MRTSIGLLPQTPICKYHSIKLKPRVEATPKWQAQYAEFQSPRRTVFRCPIPGCPFLFCGAQEYKRGYEEKKTVKSLDREFA